MSLLQKRHSDTCGSAGFFSLLRDREGAFCISPGTDREEFRFPEHLSVGYFILKDGKPEEKAFREWDHGFDFYAPQTFQDGKGRRILIGWMECRMQMRSM